MDGEEGGHKASGVAQSLGGDCQGVDVGIESPRGTKTPGVEGLPWGDETSGVTPKGDRLTGGDGRGGDENSLATRDNEGAETNRGASMESRPGLAAQPRPQRDRTVSTSRGVNEEDQEVITQRHYARDAGSRTKRSASCKYEYLDLEELTRDPADTGPLGSRDDPTEMETKEMEAGIRTVSARPLRAARRRWREGYPPNSSARFS